MVDVVAHARAFYWFKDIWEDPFAIVDADESVLTL
jgi:hypothetical protein